MEASRKISSAAEKLAALISRYPRESYIWIMPKLDLAGDLPEHLDFMVSTRKLTSNDVYEQGGGFALKKNALMALAADAGLKWVSHLSKRIDDGTNPDVVEWQATAMIADLGGLTPITRTKCIDLSLMRDQDEMKKKSEADRAKDDLQRRRFKNEMAESGAATRVVRDALGIPNIFAVEDIRTKEFAVLRVILSPKARTPQERQMILGRMLDNYMPAFPGTEETPRPVLVEGTVERAQIEAPKPAAPAEIEFTEFEDEPKPAVATAQPSPDGEVSAEPRSSATLPLESPLPSGSEKPPEKMTPEKIDFLQAVKPLKEELYALMGDSKGATTYYKLLLEVGGVQHANQLTDLQKRRTFFRRLKAIIEGARAEAAVPKEPTKPFAEALEWAREGYNKLALEPLIERIEIQMKEQQYPDDLDPLNIIPVLTQGKKPELVDAAVRLMERGLVETTKTRDQAAADPRGGGR
jgi:hypothetical protein